MKKNLSNCHLVYVSAVSCTGFTGQNIFESQLIEALRKVAGQRYGLSLEVFCAFNEDVPKKFATDSRVHLLRLRNNTYREYFRFQWRLFWLLGLDLWRNRKSDIYICFRYHESMIAPLILSYLFEFRMTIRTGPILPNLFIYGKNPSFLVYNGIKIVLGKLYQKASTIITVTKKIKQWVVETYPVSRDKVVIVPNAVNTDLFCPNSPDRKRWGLPEKEVIAGYVGCISGDRGLETMLKAIAILRERKLPSPHLLIVGDGPDLPRLKKIAEKLNISGKIKFTKKVNHEDVPSAINSCDLMLIPFTRRLLELKGSSALKLFEYLACDKFVLASQCDDHQFIEKFYLGKLIEPENELQWADALAEASKNNPSLEGRGTHYISCGYSYDILADRIINLALGQLNHSVKDR